MEVGSLETNRGERKLGRGDPVDPKLSKNVRNGPADRELVNKMENRGSSSVAGEISELSGNSAGLSLSGEEPEEEIGRNLFSAGERGPPRLVVPSEKTSSDPEEEFDFLARHHLQFSTLLEGGTNVGNFSTADWELFMAYKVGGQLNVEQINKVSQTMKLQAEFNCDFTPIVSWFVKPQLFYFTVDN